LGTIDIRTVRVAVIRFTCSSCERVLEVPDDTAGVYMTCPTCGKHLQVPAADKAAPARAESGATARPRLSAQAAPDKGMVAIQDCPECGKALQVPAGDSGRRVACPRCNHQFVAQESRERSRDVAAAEDRPRRESPRTEEEEDDRPRRSKDRDEANDEGDRREPRSGKKYCAECGAEISRRDRYCPECSAQQPERRDPVLADASSKKMAAGLCAILIGSLGVHKFILGYTTAGVIMLLVSLLTCGIGAVVMHVISIVEGITYLTKSDEDFYRIYMQGTKEWF
jgi:TM2 domain-containing membrane protein YozV/DNA-directed RNA polymerase subunit M/transcription elongation factor TFIIS